jgi:hypothetical protein
MIKGRLDTSDWERSVRKFAEVGKKNLKKVMLQQAKLVIRDVASFTPPVDKGGRGESYAKKREIGDNAVASDIYKIYRQLNEIAPIKQNTKEGRRIKKLARTDPYACKKLMRMLGYNVYAVEADVNTAHHKYNRGKTGRVNWRTSKGFVYVIRTGAVKNYIKAVQKNVGVAISGWGKAIKKLKVARIPRWATQKRSKTKSNIKIDSKDKFSFNMVATNSVRYAANTRTAPVKRAIRQQTKNIKKQINTAIRKSAKQSGF